MMPSNPSTSTSYGYLSPILDAYHKQAYNGMEVAIFPSYFHGKCQQDGVDPPGCPNPDCPVVCGTPGSMVHFYPTLREIAFNQTRTSLETLCAPESDAYQQVEQAVVNAAQAHSRRTSRIYPRAATKSAASSDSKKFAAVAGYKKPVLNASSSPRVSSSSSAAAAAVSSPDSGKEVLVPVFVKRSEEDIQNDLQHIMAQVGALLENACGGDTEYVSVDALPKCSWEQAMKEYILTFP